jgi:hypothetical protein
MTTLLDKKWPVIGNTRIPMRSHWIRCFRASLRWRLISRGRFRPSRGPCAAREADAPPLPSTPSPRQVSAP